MLKHLLNKPEHAPIHALTNQVKQAGGTAYLVGGAVRDGILGEENKDYDIEVHGLTLPEIQNICQKIGKTNIVGASFGVIKLSAGKQLDLDVSLPRRDSKQNHVKGRGIQVEADPHMGIVAALARRDFTINAIAYNLNTEQIEDPYNGIEDLKNRQLRTVDPNTFAEDPLRALRAAGFAGRFNLTATPETLRTVADAGESLNIIPAERIWEELVKLLTKSEKPSTGLKLAAETNTLQQILPELTNLINIPQDPYYHPEGDAWEHSLKTVDAAVAVAKRKNYDGNTKLATILTGLLHDVGKAPVWHEHKNALGHDSAGAELIEHRLNMLRAPKTIAAQVKQVTALHMRGHTLRENVKPSAVRKLIKDVGESNITLLADTLDADIYGRDKPGETVLLQQAGEQETETSKKILNLVNNLVSQNPTNIQNLVTGKQLIEAGIKPGEHMGYLIEEANKLDCSSVEALDIVLKLAENEESWWKEKRIVKTGLKTTGGNKKQKTL